MYYSAGNYEAFATPQKPANVDGKIKTGSHPF